MNKSFIFLKHLTKCLLKELQRFRAITTTRSFIKWKERSFIKTFWFASLDKGNLKGFQAIFETWLSRRCFLQKHPVMLRRLTREDLPLFNVKWQRKSLKVNTNICLKLWESVRLFQTMVCTKLSFFHRKTEVKWDTLFDETKGNLMLRLLTPLNSFGFCCEIYYRNVQMQRTCKNLPKVHLAVGLRDYKITAFYNEQIVLENSNSKFDRL